eukprot:COSAG01_NODE_21369_length_905_cov_0.904467_1_plen_124_part_00
MASSAPPPLALPHTGKPPAFKLAAMCSGEVEEAMGLMPRARSHARIVCCQLPLASPCVVPPLPPPPPPPPPPPQLLYIIAAAASATVVTVVATAILAKCCRSRSRSRSQGLLGGGESQPEQEE